MTEQIKLRIDGSDEFKQQVKHTLSKSPSPLNFNMDNDDPEFIIADAIPDKNVPYVVIWRRHDVSEIDKKILEISLEDEEFHRGRNLRGFFLVDDLERDPSAFFETLKEVAHELNLKKCLKEKENTVKQQKTYNQIGSKVNLGSQSWQLENLFGRPRFTALFIDKPMLELMKKLTQTLSGMKRSIVALKSHYSNEIEQIRKTQGMKGKKFDECLLERLNDLMKTHPVRFEPILLTGQTGVGKTLIARWIHNPSDEPPRANFPGSFQEINASGLSQTLMESELFGYVQGAFTDAKQDKPGLALLALGGVLFLDEIGDIPLGLQPRIMKFIEENTFRPDGWAKGFPIYSPLLVIAATNRDLEAEVKRGTFRQDFYARFRHRIHVPSIDERKDSLDSIVDLILQNPSIHRDKIKYISHEAIEKLKSIHYEENFRGLERIIKSAAAQSIDLGLETILPECIEQSK